MEGRRLLVTGGSGFIGSELVAIALQQGYCIRNLDIRRPNFEAHRSLWAEVDLRDRESVIENFRAFKPDVVIHMASEIDVNLKSLNDYSTTVGGTLNILAAVSQAANIQRFISISTQYAVMPGVQPADEKFLLPYTLYGEAKAEAEKLVWQKNLSTPWFILRPTVIWGPRHPSFSRLIWKYIATRSYLHPSSAKPIMRCYGYVRNTAHQIMAFVSVDSSRSDRHVFYLGDACINYDIWADAFSKRLTGRPARRIPKSALLFFGLAGEGIKKVGLKAPIDMGRYFRMTTSAEVDLSTTHSLIGPPQVSFEEGLSETVGWLAEENPKLFGGGQQTNVVSADR